MKLAKSLNYYYVSVITLLLFSTTLGTYYFWNYGPVNPENISNVYESSIQIENLERKKPARELVELVNNDRAREALKKLESIDDKVKKINSIVAVNEYETYQESSKKLNSSLMNLVSLPEIRSILLVLNTKVNNFKNYVERNRWRTLTRVSTRLKNRISPTKFQTRNSINHQKIISLDKYIKKDIQLMEVVTKGSILSNADKSSIISKLNTLSQELKMIESYASSLNDLSKELDNYSGVYKAWQGAILPEIEKKKLEFDNSSKYFLYLSIGLCFVLICSIFIGQRIYKSTNEQSLEHFEKETLDLIKNELIPIDSKGIKQYSKNFSNDFYRYKDYFHKRMSFGSIFQEATPFTTLMLDSNLNLIWANELFYDSWNLKSQKKEKSDISWDFLQQFTNLGENDPVMSALNDNLSGIYNIQIKTEKDSESLPYEMYVSPVEYSNQKRVMIFLYPLRSLEETISYQTKAIVGPVTRTLEALSSESYNREFSEKIKKDFEIAGIEHIYQKFQSFNEYVVSQKEGLLSEIDRLENEILDSQKLMSDVSILNNETIHTNNEIIYNFQKVKEAIIDSIDLRGEIHDLYQNTSNNSRALFKEQSNLLSKSIKANELLEESIQSFEKITSIKTKLKKAKEDTEDFKYGVNQSIDQLMIFQRKNIDDLKLQQGLNSFKLEVKSFDKVLNELTCFLTALDVALSKAEIVMDQHEIPDFSNINAVLDQIRDLIESDMFNIERVARNGDKIDERIVSSLKDTYEKFSENSSYSKDLGEMISDFKESHVEYLQEEISFESTENEGHV